MEESLKVSRSQSRIIWWTVLCGGMVTAILTLWIASDRVPADATQPLEWRGRPLSHPANGQLRIGSFNIHGGRGPDDAPVDVNATTALLSPLDLDFIGLYEVHGDFRSDQAETIGKALKMASIFAGTEYRFWHEHFGNAILSSHNVDSVLRVDWPCTQDKRFRNALLASVPLDGVPVHVLATHLDTQVDHDRQLELAISLFQSLEAPAILMGDLNCRIDHPRLAKLLKNPDVVDALAVATAPGKEKAFLIDHLFVRGLDVVSAHIETRPVSDHPLVWAELTLPTDGIGQHPEDGRSK